MKEVLYDVPLWIIAVSLLLLLTVAAELGFRGGRYRYPAGAADGEGAEFSTIQGAILGLLGLLLAFTYSLASSHYQSRKEVVVDEANSIGTALLRAELLAPPARDQMKELLSRYVDLRVELSKAPITHERASDAALAAEKMHAALWALLMSQVGGHATSPTDALLVAGMNELIDLHGRRIGALREHVPEVVIFLLIFVAFVALGIVGFAAGCRGSRNVVLTMMVSLLVVAVIDVTLDLDRPRRGLIIVSQQPMLELQASLNASR